MIGQVSSQPMSVLLAQALEKSDNVLAEALARQVAIARGAPPSFDGASAAILEALEALKIDTIGVELYDGSGISTKDRVPPAVLAQVVALAVKGDTAGVAEPADRTADRRSVRQPRRPIPGRRIQGRRRVGQGQDRIARGHLRARRLRARTSTAGSWCSRSSPTASAAERDRPSTRWRRGCAAAAALDRANPTCTTTGCV